MNGTIQRIQHPKVRAVGGPETISSHWRRQPEDRLIVPVLIEFKENIPEPIQKITPSLWFDHQAEEAATFYWSIFPNSKILKVLRYGAAGPGSAGWAMTVESQLESLPFVALNGGPVNQFTPAVSFVLNCETQAEMGAYWEKLVEGGGEIECRWVADKFGLSWQTVPTVLPELLGDSDPAKSQCATKAMQRMKKLDIATLQAAYDKA